MLFGNVANTVQHYECVAFCWQRNLGARQNLRDKPQLLCKELILVIVYLRDN